MSEGRSLIYPQAIAFGARPLAVPGRGNVLCASAIFAFRLSDGGHVKPTEWYEAISTHGDPLPIPDSMAPLPGAEVLVLGTLPPVLEASRKAFLRCGSIERRFVLHRDPDAPAAPASVDPQAAQWHKEENPDGRGGPDDDRPVLIVDQNNPQMPLWLGLTSLDHPKRQRRAGVPDEHSGSGWPSNANPSVLHDAHEAFWAEALHPGEPLAFEGLAAEGLETNLSPYRISITSGHADGRWVAEPTRIHCVTLLPAADLGAVIWRTSINLGDDILGETVCALVAALEDGTEPVKEAEHWGEVAADRWLEPEHALDDRPLLPAALAASVVLPFSMPADGDVISDRHDAAEAWMREETGVPEENPFAAIEPEEVGLAEKMQEATATGDESPVDPNEIGDMAQTALAAGKRRHEEAGFKELIADPEAPRPPEVRGLKLDSEIGRRLSTPYATQHEVSVAEQIRASGVESLDPDQVLRDLANARIQNSHPPLFWPALDEKESVRFGDKLVERLADGDLDHHIDVSGAVISTAGVGASGNNGDGDALVPGEPGADTLDQRKIAGRRLDGLLAEETVWDGIRFTNCELIDSSFAGGRFQDCDFEDCVFERVNLSRATLTGNRFANCTFRNLQLIEPVWMESKFEHCTFEQVSTTDAAMRDVEFLGGTWREMQLNNGLLVGLVLRGTEMNEVLFASTHAPHTRFERLSMFKVWVLGKGFPGSVFEDVDATTCGFLSMCHFDETRFERTRFVETGFATAVFKDAHFAAGCQFSTCDLTGAMFENTGLEGIRFLQCMMATSLWLNVEATDAWFFGSILRGVDFADTRLARAVFTDADIEGAKFQADKTIGADFRGTVNSTD